MLNPSIYRNYEATLPSGRILNFFLAGGGGGGGGEGEGEKFAVLINRPSRWRLFPKSTGISRKMEGENVMQKHLKVFRAHFRILVWQFEVIWMLK